MARTTPRVEGDTLRLPINPDTSITVGTPSWFTWLEQHTTFAFVSAQGRFTARKERNQSRGSYWKAYRKCAGQLRSVYLGRSIDLTLDRLVGAAERLAQASPAHAATIPRPPSAVCSENRLDDHHADQYGLLRTRLLMPALRPRRVVRLRLLDRLRADPTHQLILVAAPAGFGKTTLLADWIATDQRAAAWLTLDAGDNDPIRFWTAVVEYGGMPGDPNLQISGAATVSFTLNAPTITNPPAINAANKSAYPVSGTCEPGATLTIDVGGVTTTVTCSAGGTYSTTIDVSGLADGANIPNQCDTDRCGRQHQPAGPRHHAEGYRRVAPTDDYLAAGCRRE